MVSLTEFSQSLVSSGFDWVIDLGCALMSISYFAYKIKSGDSSLIDDAKDVGGQLLTYTGVGGQVAAIYTSVDWKWALSFVATLIGLWLTRQALKERRRANDLKERELNFKGEQ
jgi:hypothetical protein